MQYQLFQRLLRGLVNFIDQQQHGQIQLLYFREEFIILVYLLHHVGHVEQHISILQCREREGEHLFLQLVVGTQHAGCIGIDHLVLRFVDDADDPVARCLCLGGDDRDFLPHQPVHQCRFSHIGISNDVDKAGTMLLLFH